MSKRLMGETPSEVSAVLLGLTPAWLLPPTGRGGVGGSGGSAGGGIAGDTSQSPTPRGHRTGVAKRSCSGELAISFGAGESACAAAWGESAAASSATSGGYHVDAGHIGAMASHEKGGAGARPGAASGAWAAASSAASSADVGAIGAGAAGRTSGSKSASWLPGRPPCSAHWGNPAAWAAPAMLTAAKAAVAAMACACQSGPQA
mmetsp:Transcript_59667/g.168118  ORF Transcript_59667/g.168118 Transcript_59667/m.168118 type:complete len:204 (+) Transcript_59667:65-676(+)